MQETAQETRGPRSSYLGRPLEKSASLLRYGFIETSAGGFIACRCENVDVERAAELYSLDSNFKSSKSLTSEP